MPDQTPSPESAAPAPTGPDAGPQVEIALGPDPSIYPETLRPQPAEPAAPPEGEAPEPDEAAAPEAPDVAGAAVSPDQGETRGTRRRAAEDAYQRGLADARAQLEREQAQRQQQDQVLQTRREANERIKQLFDDLRSPDYATQDRARREVLQLYDGNQQGAAIMVAARQQILQEMAADFSNLKNLDGLADGDYQQLFEAPSAVELAKRAITIGARGKDEQIAKLEAEVQGLRGRLVGSRATPERTNGSGAPNLGDVSLESYLAMSPKEAARLTSAQIDAITAQAQADLANGRTQG